jgi:hypothetical protein
MPLGKHDGFTVTPRLDERQIVVRYVSTVALDGLAAAGSATRACLFAAT